MKKLCFVLFLDEKYQKSSAIEAPSRSEKTAQIQAKGAGHNAITIYAGSLFFQALYPANSPPWGGPALPDLLLFFHSHYPGSPLAQACAINPLLQLVTAGWRCLSIMSLVFYDCDSELILKRNHCHRQPYPTSNDFCCKTRRLTVWAGSASPAKSPDCELENRLISYPINKSYV